MRVDRRSRASENALCTDPTVTGKTLDGLIDGIDNVLASHLELHRAAGTASALDAECARCVIEDLTVARDAVLIIGRGVLLDVPDHLLAVVDEGRRVAALVSKRRVTAVILAGEDVAGESPESGPSLAGRSPPRRAPPQAVVVLP